ncbi:MAG: O-antigen ligase family protein [Chitinophagaceae bacterium]|nr:O-antigen ligase family protein [Chitinophagaceae bacterium]
MKDVFFIKDSLANRIGYYHLLVFLAALPFDRLYSELALISFALHTLIHLTRTQLRRFSIKAVLLPVSVYLLTVAGTLYTSYRAEAFYEWERQLAILLFPLLFALNSIDLEKYKLPLLKGMGLSCALAILYLYINAIQVIRYNHLPLRSIFSTAFINHNFSEPIDMHATYFSMYIALSVAAMVYAFIRTNSRGSRILYAAILLILLAGLVQLSSRSVFIALLAIINLVIPYFMLSGKDRLRFLVVSAGLTVIVLIALIQNDAFKNRYVTDLKNDLTQESINLNILEPRAVRWACGWELIGESPLIGHGSGSEVALLKEKYYEKKYFNSFVNELNIHNQFLSMLIKTGVPGLLVLLLVLIAGYTGAWRTRDPLYASFLVIITVVFFSENVLDGNKGIFFFAFFYAMFYLNALKKLLIRK